MLDSAGGVGEYCGHAPGRGAPIDTPTTLDPTRATPDLPLLVTLDPATWYRGFGPQASALVTRDGRSCCLGFAARACGVPPHALLDVRTWAGEGPTGVRCALRAYLPPTLAAWATLRHVSLSGLYALNDRWATIDDTERVRLLNAEAAEQRVPFRFVLAEAP